MLFCRCVWARIEGGPFLPAFSVMQMKEPGAMGAWRGLHTTTLRIVRATTWRLTFEAVVLSRHALH